VTGPVDQNLTTQEAGMCDHVPTCPPSTSPDHGAARVVAGHPVQGWSLLCNGVVLFDDYGELFPDGHALPPPPALALAAVGAAEHHRA